MKTSIKLIFSILGVAVIFNFSIFADCKMENGAYAVGLSNPDGKRITLKIEKPANSQSDDVCSNFKADNTGVQNIRIPVKPIKLDGAAIEQQYKDLVTSIQKTGVSAKVKKGKAYTRLKMKFTERADFSKPGPMGGFRTILQGQSPIAKISVTIDLEQVQAKDGKIVVGEQTPELSVEYSAEFK